MSYIDEAIKAQQEAWKILIEKAESTEERERLMDKRKVALEILLLAKKNEESFNTDLKIFSVVAIAGLTGFAIWVMNK